MNYNIVSYLIGEGFKNVLKNKLGIYQENCGKYLNL